ncbi:unnamed protein product, partial [Effrenium voratum]
MIVVLEIDNPQMTLQYTDEMSTSIQQLVASYAGESIEWWMVDVDLNLNMGAGFGRRLSRRLMSVSVQYDVYLIPDLAALTAAELAQNLQAAQTTQATDRLKLYLQQQQVPSGTIAAMGIAVEALGFDRKTPDAEPTVTAAPWSWTTT